MIDKNLEKYYDKILSIFIGVITVLIIHNLYDYPRTIIIKSTEKYKKKYNKKCF
tara:strand:+ start:285 stop:446 length:162 start_codon:yes stop_codon:yes gene_type:complete